MNKGELIDKVAEQANVTKKRRAKRLRWLGLALLSDASASRAKVATPKRAKRWKFRPPASRPSPQGSCLRKRWLSRPVLPVSAVGTVMTGQLGQCWSTQSSAAVTHDVGRLRSIEGGVALRLLAGRSPECATVDRIEQFPVWFIAVRWPGARQMQSRPAAVPLAIGRAIIAPLRAWRWSHGRGQIVDRSECAVPCLLR
jgi:hypothetical protein